MQNKYPNNLKLIRTWREISQIELADRSRCSQSRISRFEAGTVEITRQMREIFAKILQVPQRMLEDPVTVVPQEWGRLISDPRLTILVEELLKYDTVRISKAVHNVSKERKL